MKYLKLGILLIFLILATGVSFAMTDDNNSSLESNDPAAIESEQGNIEKLSVANQAKNSDIGPIQNCCSILSTSKSDEDSNKSANDKLGIQAVDNGNTQSVYINDINMSNNISKSKIGTTNITPLKSSSKYAYYRKGKLNKMFQYEIIVPKWGGNKVKIVTKKLTSLKVSCNVYYTVTYYKKTKYKGKATTIRYPCIFNLAMKKGKTVTVNLPTKNIQSFRWKVQITKFP